LSWTNRSRRRVVGLGSGGCRPTPGRSVDGVPEPPVRPEFRTLARVVSDRLAGDVIRAELRWERWRPVPSSAGGRTPRRRRAAGLLLDLFPHLLDQACVLFGPVETVYAELFAYTTVGEDTAFLSCRHTSVGRVALGSTSLAAAPGPWLRLLGREGA
jgi:predicted dehydrogenase